MARISDAVEAKAALQMALVILNEAAGRPIAFGGDGRPHYGPTQNAVGLVSQIQVTNADGEAFLAALGG